MQGKVIGQVTNNCTVLKSCCFTFAQSVITVVPCEAVIVDSQYASQK